MRGWRASLLLIFIGAVALSVVFFATHRQRTPSSPAIDVATSEPASLLSRSSSTNASPITNLVGTQAEANPGQFPTNRTSYTPPAPPLVEPTPASKTLPPETVLENMRTTLRNYLSTFGENPVGNNAEITKALLGENSKHINFLKNEDGNRVNANGELVDVWGTPYFFHQLSAHEMEIRSAGPDGKMWTSDDLVTQ